MMDWGSRGGHFGAEGWIGMAFMIVFWIAVVVAIVYLIRYLAARPHGDRRHEGPANWRHRRPRCRRAPQRPYASSRSAMPRARSSKRNS